jgi:hypothetical protein
VDPVPDPLLIRTFGSAGNRTRTFGSVARNSHHKTIEAVTIIIIIIIIIIITTTTFLSFTSSDFATIIFLQSKVFTLASNPKTWRTHRNYIAKSSKDHG